MEKLKLSYVRLYPEKQVCLFIFVSIYAWSNLILIIRQRNISFIRWQDSLPMKKVINYS